MSKKKDGFPDSLWNFFCSLKLTILLLICLAAVSIIGTVIPQNAPPEQYFKLYTDSTVRIFSTLHFFDMYHSWWFIALLYLLSLNLLACSVKRLSRDLRFLSSPHEKLDEGLEKTIPLLHHFKMAGNSVAIKDAMAACLSAEFASPRMTEIDGEYHLFAQKMPLSRFGVYFVHFSIIVIFAGATIGSLFGYRGYVNIEEGAETSAAYVRKASTGTGTPQEIPVDLGFTVRCDQFTVSFYDNGMPKEYKSLLTVIDHGRKVFDRRPVRVNSPLSYKGITFYQSGYGPAGNPTFHLGVRDGKTGAKTEITAPAGEKVSVPGGYSVQVMDYTDDISPMYPHFSGPALRAALSSPTGEPQAVILLKNYPDFDNRRGGNLIFTYDGMDQKWSTGLQVTKDPGVWVVWLGCAMMIGGIAMAFLMSHRRIWIRIKGSHVTIAGVANKNQGAFQVLFEQLVEKLKAT